MTGMAARMRRSRYEAIRRTHSVVLAKAGTDTPGSLDGMLQQGFETTTQAGGYGSLLSQGRLIEVAECCRNPS
jgi:glycosyltransferase A (GT-A) superfamily protein (DUF2064 family)